MIDAAINSASPSSEKDVVTVEIERGVAWVTLNRPDKRNAMSPALNRRMLDVLDEVEADDRVGVMVLTGAGDAFSAGMDLKEYFRAPEGNGRAAVLKVRREAYEWKWRRLRYFEKPTIAMVNGWCFGGAFTPLVSCDLSIAAEEATFGISEVNWGIIPGGNVTKAIASKMRHADALWYMLTGDTFDGRKAAEMGLVNRAVPLVNLRAEVRALADKLLEKNPMALKAAKDAFKRVDELNWEAAEEYLVTKQDQLNHLDKTDGRKQGMKQFLDDKTYRPGLGAYDRGEVA